MGIAASAHHRAPQTNGGQTPANPELTRASRLPVGVVGAKIGRTPVGGLQKENLRLVRVGHWELVKVAIDQAPFLRR